MRPEITPFRHQSSGTFSYVVRDPDSGALAVIDPVVDYDPVSGEIATEPADAVIEHLRRDGGELLWVLETHAHADHLAGGRYLRERLGGTLAIGSGIRAVQRSFAEVFHLPELATDGSQFDRLLEDGETLALGALELRVIATPGHTSDSCTYLIGDVAFVGDSLFMPDSGTARCDFPGGDAGLLFDSIQRLFELPDETRVFVCHDYGAGGSREPACQTTVGEQRRANIHVGGGASREAFVERREARDATLSLPRLIYPSVQYNIRAGSAPPPEANGGRYFKIPLRGHLG